MYLKKKSEGGGINLVCRFSSPCLLRLLAAASTYLNIYLRSCQAASGGKLEKEKIYFIYKGDLSSFGCIDFRRKELQPTSLKKCLIGVDKKVLIPLSHQMKVTCKLPYMIFIISITSPKRETSTNSVTEFIFALQACDICYRALTLPH